MSAAERIRQITEVCPIPATAARVMKLCADPRVDIGGIAKVIATDAALTAEVLKLANSPGFGGRREVATLEHACTMIGITRVAHIATAMAMLGAFRSEAQDHLPFYETAIVTGGLCQALAVGLNEDKGTGFVVGLLSEIGAMAIAAVDAHGYLELYRSASSIDGRWEKEVSRYQATSAQIGAELLERNGLPALISDSISTTATGPDTSTMGRIAAFSREAVPFICRSPPPESGELEEALPNFAARYGIELDTDGLRNAVIQAAKKAQAALSS